MSVREADLGASVCLNQAAWLASLPLFEHDGLVTSELIKEEFKALTPLPEFDCSDVVEAAKNSVYSPKTSDNYLMLFVIPAVWIAFAKIKKICKGLKCLN